jgi:hypothetical protein
MEMTYENLSADDLRGSTLADYLIAIDADFKVLDGAEVVYAEPYFPVVELARALALWAGTDEDDAEDFVFESLTFDEPGAVVVARSAEGWVFGSRLTPGVTSSVLDWEEVRRAVGSFERQIREDVVRLKADPRSIFSS